MENGLQEEWMELEVTYFDSKEQRLCLQKESLVDNNEWKTVKDGDLLCQTDYNSVLLQLTAEPILQQY
mgnify:CR=1 FL=1